MIHIDSSPYPNWLARLIVKTATSLGFGENYVVGYGNYNINEPIVPKAVAPRIWHGTVVN